ncbi:MAG: glycosyltransferase family 4 protein [Rhodobiaceae bacterium]|nr:glycosyltransferase family 4 protein [Rhodobiaceae bacterium]MCC0056785.1 glycosyltransferase family 4 protein [Rhodobiaceae bacterium]
MLRQTMPHEIRQGATSRPLNILVCPDQPDWAFDNIAQNIARFAGENRLSKLFMKDVIGNEHKFFETIFLKRIDLCHVFWREDLFYLFHPQTIEKAARALGIEYETLVRAFNSCAFTTSVYDHLFSKPEEMRARRSGFAALDGYTVSSSKLFDIYSRESSLPAPDLIISDGVDTEHFSPATEQSVPPSVHLIGWAGNPGWGKSSEGYDVKGYDRVFRPMMAELTARGHRVGESAAIPQVKRIPFSQMPNFYRNLDIFACTSAIEGTPNTVLEAMACGVPVVSTNVGIVPDIFGPLQRRFIIEDASADSFADASAELIASPELRRAISAENRERALDWSWEIKVRDWWPFWEGAIRHAMDRRGAIRREALLLARDSRI